jgi:hypothetical protein
MMSGDMVINLKKVEDGYNLIDIKEGNNFFLTEIPEFTT